MTHRQFRIWLDKLKSIWETKNPNAATNLVAEKFLWYETPFDQPFTVKEQLIKEWKTVLNQEDISVTDKILSVNENFGIARWKATFIRFPSHEKATLEGIYQVSLNQKGECVEFHQWYNSK